MTVHVRSDITGRIDCGLEPRAGRLTISRNDYIAALGRNRVADELRLRFGEGACLCRRCQRSA